MPDVSSLIELLKINSLDSLEIMRLSPEAGYEKREPSFSVIFEGKRIKLRRITEGNLEVWHTRSKIIKKLNGIEPGTLPEIFHVGNSFVLSEYIEGKKLQEEEGIDYQKLALGLYGLHINSHKTLRERDDLFENMDEKLLALTEADLDYIKKLNLFERVKMLKIEKIIREGIKGYTRGLVHGDISLHNLVETSENKYRLIDLESSRPFPIEYDFVKPMQDIFHMDPKIFERAYGDLLKNYKRNQNYWVLFYLLRKIVERSQINRPIGIEKAVRKIREII